MEGGENNSSNPATYNIERSTIIFADATKTGYTFKGWFSDGEYRTSITEIAKGSYGIVEVYAKWEITTYSVTYVLQQGATNTNILEYTIETDITVL